MNQFLITVCLVIYQLMSSKSGVSALVVEVYVAIDQRVIQDYIYHGSAEASAEDDARSDAVYFMEEVSNHMQATGTGIEVYVRQMDILASDVFDQCQLRDGEGIHEDLGLQTFTRYLEAQGLKDSLNYDMALLWTGYNIYGKSDSTAGYATVGSICEENAATIVEYDGTYRTVLVTAHEIGHILGLEHDEGDCDNGYVMSETLGFSSERWTFSSCSISTLSDLIPGMDCLTETSSQSQIPEGTVSDNLLDPNAVCRRGRNQTDSYLCKSSNLYGDIPPQGDAVCQRIYCYDSETTYCYSAHTTNSMICGLEHRCLNGICVTAPDDFPVPEGLEAHCLYGDTQSLKLSGLSEPTTCEDFFSVSSNRFQCYSTTIELACCETCGSLKSDIPGCPYGDRSSQCVQYSQSQVCPTYKDTLCCEHCSDWTSKRSADSNENPPVLKPIKINRMKQEKTKPKKDDEVSNTYSE